MTDDLGFAPMNFPENWARAHDLWKLIGDMLPPSTPPEWKTRIEKDVYDLFERSFENSSRALGTSECLLVELAIARIELAILKEKVHALEDRHGP